MTRFTQVASKAPGLVLDARHRQGDLGITYSQSQTPSRGHPVHHRETSRRPLNPPGPPASQSSRCASVEPGRVQTHTGLGTQSIGLYRPKRQQAHSQAECPLCAPESWVWAGSHFPPTQGHGSRTLPYQPAATGHHHPQPAPQQGAPYTGWAQSTQC